MAHLFGTLDDTVLTRPEIAYHYSDSKPDMAERVAASDIIEDELAKWIWKNLV